MDILEKFNDFPNEKHEYTENEKSVFTLLNKLNGRGGYENIWSYIDEDIQREI